MLSLKPRPSKEENTREQNWQNVAEDTSKLLMLGIAVGTAASIVVGGGLPITIGTAVGGITSLLVALYDLSMEYPGLTEEEKACMQELDTRRKKLKDGKVKRKCGDCFELPPVAKDELGSCIVIRERLREDERDKSCVPCKPGEICEAEGSEAKTVKKVHPDLAKEFKELKPYQQSTYLKQFSSKRRESFWDNYVAVPQEDQKQKSAKPVPLKRFTTPSYRRND